MENKKLSSVEWLQIQLKKGIDFNPLNPLSYPKAVDNLFEQAKAMHKEEIKEAIMFGDCRGEVSTYKILEQYYNETFGGK